MEPAKRTESPSGTEFQVPMSKTLINSEDSAASETMLPREQHFQGLQRGSHPEGAQDIVKTERNRVTTVTKKKENRALRMNPMASSTEREQYAKELNRCENCIYNSAAETKTSLGRTPQWRTRKSDQLEIMRLS